MQYTFTDKAGDNSGARGRGKVGLGALDWPMPGVVWMSRECKRPDLWVEKLGAQQGCGGRTCHFCTCALE